MRKTIHLSEMMLIKANPFIKSFKKTILPLSLLLLVQMTAGTAHSQETSNLIEISGQVTGQDGKEPLSDVSVSV